MATGTGSFVKLGSTTAPFGDTVTTSTNPDWPVLNLYKWIATTNNPWGTATNRTMWSSGMFAQSGANLFNEAAAAVALYAK